MPTEITTEEARATRLIARLQRTRPTYRDFTWPGGALACRIRVATGDRQQALAAAVDRFAELGLVAREGGKIDASALVGDDFAEEVITQLLARVIEDVEKPIAGDPLGRCEPLFASGDELRDLTTEGERAAIWQTYRDIQVQADPDGAELSEAEAALVLEALKKKDATRLRACDASTLRRFLLTTADLLLSCLNGTSDVSSRPTPST